MEDVALEKMPIGHPTTSSRLLSITKAASRNLVELIRPAILTRSPRPLKLRRTAYLDGLRGFAAFLVMWMHNIFWTHGMAIGILESGWGWDGRYHFITFPFVRTLFSGGHLAVACFYVISGYVLTTKPLTLIQAGRFTELGDNLASALFRRWLRLYIPVAATTFVYMSFWHATGVFPEWPKAKDSYAAELWHWYTNFKNYSFVFKDEPVPWCDYNTHTWSIPVEFQGSIIVFTACMAFSRCSTNARLLLEIGLILYFYIIVNGWYGALFLSGMLLGDLDLLAEKDELPLKSLFTKLSHYKRTLWYTVFIVALWLGGCPSHDESIEHFRTSPGWYYISFLRPSVIKDPKWAFLFWAATFLVAAIPRIRWLKSFFESRFCQYLGRNSFSLYLIHGPVIWLFADRVYAAFGITKEWHFEHIPNWVNRVQVPEGGPLGLDLPFLIPAVFIVIPFTLWIAEISTKLFDQTSLRFSQWFYRKALAVEVLEK